MTSKEKVLGVYPTIEIVKGPFCYEHYKYTNLKSLSMRWPNGFFNECVTDDNMLWDKMWDYISDAMLRKLES